MIIRRQHKFPSFNSPMCHSPPASFLIYILHLFLPSSMIKGEEEEENICRRHRRRRRRSHRRRPAPSNSSLSSSSSSSSSPSSSSWCPSPTITARDEDVATLRTRKVRVPDQTVHQLVTNVGNHNPA